MNQYAHRTTRRTGFSLLGVLVGFGMTLLVIAALAQLAVRTGQATRLTRDRLVAAHLAREGIELVRAVRDGNWLASPRCPSPDPTNFDTYACRIWWRGGTPGTQPICSDGVYTVQADNLTLVPAVAGGNETQLYLSSLSYQHTPSTSAPTPFRRWVLIESAEDPGCGQPSVFVLPTPTPTPTPSPVPSPTPTPSPPPTPFHPQRITVTAVVQWTEEGRTKEVRMVDELFPWMHIR